MELKDLEMKDSRPYQMWVDMPRFVQKKKDEIKVNCLVQEDGGKVFIRFRNEKDLLRFKMLAPIPFDGIHTFKDRDHLSKVTDQKITERTKSIWFPFKSHWGGVNHKWISTKPAINRYPIYVVSKGRSDNGLTTKALAEMNVKHYIVCEHEEYELYKKSANNFAKIIILPSKYLDEYDTCDSLGDSKSKGPGAARNFCIDHSHTNGFRRHWVMDDNLDAFHYMTDNEKLECETPAIFAYAEDFIERYENIPISGFNYYSFCKKNDGVPPFVLNTRIYSCLLIDNQSGYRWRGRYNEDTDLSLRALKDGNCTIQFNSFLCGKVTTQRMKGGNTKEFYAEEGTKPKSDMIQMLHPDVAKVVWKFNRWHHHVNYSPFKSNHPIPSSSDFKKNHYSLVKVRK